MLKPRVEVPVAKIVLIYSSFTISTVTNFKE